MTDLLKIIRFGCLGGSNTVCVAEALQKHAFFKDFNWEGIAREARNGRIDKACFYWNRTATNLEF